jgi:thymidylate synthase
MNFNKQYLNTIQTVLQEGEYLQGRNSAVLQYFCPNSIIIPDTNKEFPILSVRKIPFYKSALETFFFLGGESSYDSMPESLKNSWWKPWAEKAKAQNSWGNFYSHNWRHQTTELNSKGFDQWENLLKELCEVIKTGVINRKMCVSLWDKAGTMPEYTTKPSVLDCCLPEHSNVLTKAGFKSIKNVGVGEEVWATDLGFNGHWSKVLAKQHFKNQEVEVHSNSNWTIEATANHRWLIQTQTGKRLYKTTSELEGTKYSIPTRVTGITQKDSILTQDEARLLGWLLTDGTWKKTYYSGSIHQVKPQYVKVISKLLERMGVKNTWNAQTKHFYLSADIVKPLLKKAGLAGVSKQEASIAHLLPNLGKKELRSLLITIIQAEGSIKPGGPYCIYQSVKSPIAKDITALIVLTGLAATTIAKPPRPSAFGKEYCNTYTPRTGQFFQMPKLKSTYNADVYCITTEAGNFLCEQNNKTFISGNCHSSFLSFNLVPKWHEDELNSGYSPYQEWYLDLHHTQRSLDLMCGTGSDLIYSGLIMHLLCDEVSNRMYNVNSPEQTPIIKPRKLVFSPSNVHIYESHIKETKQLLLLNSQSNNYSPAKISLQGPICDFTQYKTIEEIKQVVNLKNYNPNWGNYNFELLG